MSIKIRSLLLAWVNGIRRKVEYFDAFIYRAVVYDECVGDEDVELLSLECQRVIRDDEPQDENGNVIRDWSPDDYGMITIPVDTENEGSLYLQLVVALCHNEDIPTESFDPYEVEGKFVRFVFRRGELLEIQPFLDVSEKMREYYSTFIEHQERSCPPIMQASNNGSQ